MRVLFSILILFSLQITVLQAQDALDYKREADALYRLEKYDEALDLYRRSLALENRPETLFNLGNTLYKLDRHEEASQYFAQAKESFADRSNRSDAAHNLGNSFFENMDLQQAVNAFRESLILNPANEDARNNFLLARELLQMMPPQPQPDQGGEGTDEDQEQPEGPADAGGEDQEGQDEGSSDQDESGDEGQDEADPLTESSADETAASDAAEQHPEQVLLDQLLDLAEEEDQRTQRRMNEQRRQPSQQLRDW